MCFLSTTNSGYNYSSYSYLNGTGNCKSATYVPGFSRRELSPSVPHDICRIHIHMETIILLSLFINLRDNVSQPELSRTQPQYLPPITVHVADPKDIKQVKVNKRNFFRDFCHIFEVIRENNLLKYINTI